jgi:hypothetical protein
VRSKAAAALVLVLVAAAAGAAGARAAPGLQTGIADTAGALYDDPDRFYPLLTETHVQVLRVHLYWGGRLGVARRRPVEGVDPDDPAYDWRRYDRIVLQAHAHGISVLFSVFGTPPWANGGAPTNRAPRDPDRLWEFSYAAASRYSGTSRRGDGVVLPAVRRWTAWNEPNLRLGLVPQWRRVGGKWRVQSAVDYAGICNAVVDGVHATLLAGERVACGVTAARGNNDPTSRLPSVSPLAFLRAMRAAGATGFDAYAHHPYHGTPSETPSTRPRGANAVTLANIDRLDAELRRLYGHPFRLWLTEYGYETSPPDRVFGVTWAAQARYLREAYAIARANPRIDLLVWFLLHDEPRAEGWQSGLVTAAGVRKPAFGAFAALAAGGDSGARISGGSAR